MNKFRRYSDLIQLQTFEERYEYLKLNGSVGADTFGYERYLNQKFYKTTEWRHLRNQIIVRDLSCDLACPEYELFEGIYIHHMNPITVEDIIHGSDYSRNPEFLICTSFQTHQAIHYGSIETTNRDYVPRSPNDTCPWR